MVPLTDEDTDRKRQCGELPLERPHQGEPLPGGCRGELDTRLPLMLERLGPGGELRVIERPSGLDRTHARPALTAADWHASIGGIPTVKADRDLEGARQPLLYRCQHIVGETGLLAKAQPLLGGALPGETPHGLRAEIEPPIIGIGPCGEC